MITGRMGSRTRECATIDDFLSADAFDYFLWLEFISIILFLWISMTSNQLIPKKISTALNRTVLLFPST